MYINIIMNNCISINNDHMNQSSLTFCNHSECQNQYEVALTYKSMTSSRHGVVVLRKEKPEIKREDQSERWQKKTGC